MLRCLNYIIQESCWSIPGPGFKPSWLHKLQRPITLRPSVRNLVVQQGYKVMKPNEPSKAFREAPSLENVDLRPLIKPST